MIKPIPLVERWSMIDWPPLEDDEEKKYDPRQRRDPHTGEWIDEPGSEIEAPDLPKWKKEANGHYDLPGTDYAVIASRDEMSSDEHYERTGRNMVGRTEWAVVKKSNEDNLSWHDTLKEAKAEAERLANRDRAEGREVPPPMVKPSAKPAPPEPEPVGELTPKDERYLREIGTYGYLRVGDDVPLDAVERLLASGKVKRETRYLQIPGQPRIEYEVLVLTGKKFNPNQPRDPGGEGGGQWVSGGGTVGATPFTGAEESFKAASALWDDPEWAPKFKAFEDELESGGSGAREATANDVSVGDAVTVYPGTKREQTFTVTRINDSDTVSGYRLPDSRTLWHDRGRVTIKRNARITVGSSDEPPPYTRQIGVYKGSFEPSYSIEVDGEDALQKIRAMHSLEDQEAVSGFLYDKDGPDSELSISGIGDPDEFWKHMAELGVEGGSFHDDGFSTWVTDPELLKMLQGFAASNGYGTSARHGRVDW